MLDLYSSRPRRSSPSPGGRADLGAQKGAATSGPEARVSFWQRLLRASAALDESWIGAAIGAACLFASAYLLFFFLGVLA